MKYIKKRYAVVSLEMLWEHLFRKKGLPENPLLITFDDGDRTVLEHGLPILKEEGLPGCLFIVSGLIDTDQDFWWETIRRNEKEMGRSDLEIARKVKSLKQTSNASRLEFMNKYPSTSRPQLKQEELHLLQNSNVFIGNHSHTHPMFDRCTREELRREMDKSRAFFDHVGLPGFRIFAYPNGNHSHKAEKILRSNRIEMAFLFDHRINSRVMDPLRISRLIVNDHTPLWKFKFILSGAHSRILPITKKVGLLKRRLKK